VAGGRGDGRGGVGGAECGLRDAEGPPSRDCWDRRGGGAASSQGEDGSGPVPIAGGVGVQEIPGVRFHAVTHSLGGLVARHLPLELGVKFHRICMMCPPSQGSTLARVLKSSPLGPVVSKLYGPVIEDLSRGDGAAMVDSADGQLPWPVPDADMALVMGTRSISLKHPVSWLAKLLQALPGPSDGTVMLDEMHVGPAVGSYAGLAVYGNPEYRGPRGAEACALAVHESHMFIMYNPAAKDACARFVMTGTLRGVKGSVIIPATVQRDVLVAGAEALRRGRVVAVPTDTLYGVACDASSGAAVERICNVKGRNMEKAPLAVCVAAVDQVSSCGDTSHLPKGMLDLLLPGAVTVILPRKSHDDAISPELNKGLPSVGVRVPDSPFIRALCKAHGGPLALTSANLSGEMSPLDISDFEAIWERIAVIYDGGKIPSGRTGSTIVDLSKGVGTFTIIRKGEVESLVRGVMKRFRFVETTP